MELKLKRWNPEQIDYLKNHYSDTSQKELVRQLGFTESQIKNKAYKFRLKKSQEHIEKMRQETLFKKGQTSWNSGKKGIKYPGSEKSQFKKGNLPHNTKQDGAISMRKDNNGKYHEFVRVALGKWIHRKIIVWEQHHGEIPKGMCIRVKDGNTMNSAIENLEMVTRKQNRVMNTGSNNLSDGFIALSLTRKSPELRQAVLGNKELINLQRKIIQANRLCKTNSKQQM